MTWWEGLVERPSVYSRNAIAYIVARNWRAEAKAEQIAALRKAKVGGCCATCGAAVDAVAGLIRKLGGEVGAACVTSVPCGHSRVPDCLGKRMAMGVAEALGLPFVQLWADRFVAGSSHPRLFDQLPPLKWIAKPAGRVLLVDDVATSGWHLEEALGALRAAGVEAAAFAWIGGKRDGEREDAPPPPPVFGGARRARRWRPGAVT